MKSTNCVATQFCYSIVVEVKKLESSRKKPWWKRGGQEEEGSSSVWHTPTSARFSLLLARPYNNLLGAWSEWRDSSWWVQNRKKGLERRTRKDLRTSRQKASHGLISILAPVKQNTPSLDDWLLFEQGQIRRRGIFFFFHYFVVPFLGSGDYFFQRSRKRWGQKESAKLSLNDRLLKSQCYQTIQIFSNRKNGMISCNLWRSP